MRPRADRARTRWRARDDAVLRGLDACLTDPRRSWRSPISGRCSRPATARSTRSTASASRSRPGELLGVVGESGSGKSVTMMSLMGLLPSPPAEVVGGSILYQGREVRQMSTTRAARSCAAASIGFVFQDPMTSLNPVFTVGYQLIEPIRAHLGLSQAAARARAAELLALVGIPDAGAPARRLSAPVLRRHAPAGDDRDGAGLRPEGADRRRADHRARRDHPGADPRDRARAARSGSAWGSSGSPTTWGWSPASPTG